MQSAKNKIKQCVDTYIMICPEEFATFKEMMVERRHNLKDEKFGQAKDGSTMRALFEIPETLHNIIIKQLNVDELEWFKAGGANHLEGGRWFATTFPVFRLPDAI